jgi:hypothetical protein
MFILYYLIVILRIAVWQLKPIEKYGRSPSNQPESKEATFQLVIHHFNPNREIEQ